MNARDAAELCNRVARYAASLDKTSQDDLALLWSLIEYTYSLGCMNGVERFAERLREDFADVDAKAAVEKARG